MGCLRSKFEKQLSREERVQAVKNMLEHNLPVRTLTITAIIGIIFGLCAIGFQIAAIVVKAQLYYVGVG
jgi:hypothetical protein